MAVPQGEDVAAVLALAPPELRGCEPVVALERLIADRDEELAFLRERCVQFEVRAGEPGVVADVTRAGLEDRMTTQGCVCCRLRLKQSLRTCQRSCSRHSRRCTSCSSR